MAIPENSPPELINFQDTKRNRKFSKIVTKLPYRKSTPYFTDNEEDLLTHHDVSEEDSTLVGCCFKTLLLIIFTLCISLASLYVGISVVNKDLTLKSQLETFLKQDATHADHHRNYRYLLPKKILQTSSDIKSSMDTFLENNSINLNFMKDYFHSFERLGFSTDKKYQKYQAKQQLISQQQREKLEPVVDLLLDNWLSGSSQYSDTESYDIPTVNLKDIIYEDKFVIALLDDSQEMNTSSFTIIPKRVFKDLKDLEHQLRTIIQRSEYEFYFNSEMNAENNYNYRTSRTKQHQQQIYQENTLASLILQNTQHISEDSKILNSIKSLFTPSNSLSSYFQSQDQKENQLKLANQFLSPQQVKIKNVIHDQIISLAVQKIFSKFFTAFRNLKEERGEVDANGQSITHFSFEFEVGKKSNVSLDHDKSKKLQQVLRTPPPLFGGL